MSKSKIWIYSYSNHTDMKIMNLLTILPESALSSELISLMLDGTEGCKLRLLKCSRLGQWVLPLQSRDWTRVGPGSQLDLMHWTRYSAPPALRSLSWSCEAPGRRWRWSPRPPSWSRGEAGWPWLALRYKQSTLYTFRFIEVVRKVLMLLHWKIIYN